MPCPVPWEVWPSMSATNPQGAMGYWNKIHTHFIEIWSDSLTKASRDPTHRFCTFHFLHTSGYWASLLYFSWELGHSILNGVCQPWTRGVKSCPDSCHNGCLSLNTYGSSSKSFSQTWQIVQGHSLNFPGSLSAELTGPSVHTQQAEVFATLA